MSESAFVHSPFNLAERHAHFNEDGSVTLIDAHKLWSLPQETLNERFGRLLVSCFQFSEDWRTWEMHPHGDELVYLLSGEADLLLRLPEGDSRIRLTTNNGHLVPAGVWHTAHTNVPCQLLVVTRGKDTQVVDAADMAYEP